MAAVALMPLKATRYQQAMAALEQAFRLDPTNPFPPALGLRVSPERATWRRPLSTDATAEAQMSRAAPATRTAAELLASGHAMV